MNSRGSHIGHSSWSLASLEVTTDLRKVTVELTEVLVFDEGLPDSLEQLWFGIPHLLPVALLFQLFEQELFGHVEGLLVLHQLHINLTLVCLKLLNITSQGINASLQLVVLSMIVVDLQ